MPKLYLPSLAGGEVSPAIGARVDLNKYSSSLELLLNFVVLPFGGVQSRPGQEFVAEIKDSARTGRIIPFEYNTEQTYILEFTNQNMRVIKDGAPVVESAVNISGATKANPVVVTTATHSYSTGDEVFISGVVGMTELNGRNFKITVLSATTFSLQDNDGTTNINGSGYTAYASGGTSERVYEISTPYVEADLYELKYVQSNDVMTICHPGYAPRELTRTDHDAWTLTTISFRPEQAAPTGISVTVNSAASVTDRYAVCAVNAETAERSLRGLGATSTISGATKANPIVITDTGHPYDDGDLIYISGVVGMTELNDNYYFVTGSGTNDYKLQGLDRVNVNSTAFTTYTSGGTSAGTFRKVTNSNTTRDNTVTWTAAADAGSYDIFREKDGVFGFIGRAIGTTFEDDNIEPDLADTPPTLREPFKDTNTYPSTVSYHQQRRVFANTVTKPQTMYFTQTGNHYNLSTSQPANDDDAITMRLTARKVNAILSMIPLKDLIVLTSGGEWLITQSGDAGFAPATVKQEPQTYYGATDLPPILVGDVVIYMQPGDIVRDIGYKFETDAYSGNDISVLARHLFEGYTIDAWDFSGAPHGNLWCVRSDGRLLCLTYLREQEVYGWSQHSTQGNYECVAVIREGDRDVPYFLVNRTINGTTRRFIERHVDRDFDDVQDAKCLDSMLSLDSPITISGYTTANPVVITTANAHGLTENDVIDITGIKKVSSDTTETTGEELSDEIVGNGYIVGTVGSSTTFQLKDVDGTVNGSTFAAYSSGGVVRKAVTTVTGLWHLEGHSVGILANGSALPAQTVSGGAITLTTAASRVHVGLPYTCRLRTLRPNVPQRNQATSQGRKRRVHKLGVRVEDTLGLWHGPDLDHMSEAKFRANDVWGQPKALITDEVSMTVSPDWNNHGRMYLEQRDPLPCTIIALVPDYELGEL